MYFLLASSHNYSLAILAVLAGYKLGVVEAILYVVVIGMSIDYSVHGK